MTNTARIKTNIKFYKGLNNVSNRLYGFVTKEGSSWRGCREEHPKKKVVFVDHLIASDIIPNALYRCTLIPMKNGNGFIAKTATLVQFPALIRTKCSKDSYIVTVSFGNKCLCYDPSSSKPRENNIKAIAEDLRTRIDIQNGAEVAERFIDNALAAKRMYEVNKQNVL